MIRSICLWLVRFCVRHVTSWPWPRLLSGLACGLMLIGLQQQYLAQLGSSLPVTAAASTIIILALAFAWRRPAVASASNTGLTRNLAVPALLAGVSLLSPTFWGLHELVLNELIVTSRAGLFVYATLWATLILGCPVWCVGRLSLLVDVEPSSSSSSPSTVRPSAAFLFGISVGLGLALAVTWGSLYAATITGGIILFAAQPWALKSPSSPIAIAASTKSSAETSAEFATRPLASPAVIAAACGGLALWSVHVLELLLPATIFTLTAVVSGLLFGIACGYQFAGGKTRSRPTLSALVHGGTVLVLLGLSAGFSWIVFRLVTLTGSVSQVWLLHSVRWLLVGCCVAPIGFVWAWAVARLESISEKTPSPFTTLSASSRGLLLALLGGTITGAILIPVCGLNATCYLGLGILAAARLLEAIQTRDIPKNTLVRGFVLASLCLLIAAPTISRGVRPELAARLLFATNVFLADQGGIPRRELPFLDEGRLESQVAGEHGTYTVWKFAVARHQIRENGIPRGNLSTSPEFSPQDTGEILLSLLPLTLHEEPRRVAILGMGTSLPLQAGLSSPVLEINTVETDPQLVSVLKAITRHTPAESIWQDERLKLTTADPALWVAGSSDQYDVVISNPQQSALVQNSSQYTREFYRRAARRLTADGIFCQRFQFVDYGPRPLQTIAATLRGAFRHVMAVEIGSGEIAWLATNAESGLIRKNLVDRMQATHVRELMAQVGWDWSVLLTLGAYDDALLEKFLDNASPGLNTATNGRFCTRLPTELMRWGSKSEEVQNALTVHAGKILSWIGEAATEDDLLRRLAEVQGQQELVAKFPDQYWGYRSQVKKQISTRPIPRIQQAKYEQHKADKTAALHPDDKRRLRYFEQLSKAIHGQQPADVVQLAGFSTPYDPLVSLFMHQEVAEIAAQVPGLPANFELTHRLHMIYFSPIFDSSIRNPLTALRLVLEKPDAVDSNVARWDVINGLLQTLQNRWQHRGTTAVSNARLVARDTEENIVLVERALQELPKLRADVGFSAEDWDARKRSIERNLVRPLREYRERLQPMAVQQRFETPEEPLDSALPSEEDLQYPGSNLPLLDASKIEDAASPATN